MATACTELQVPPPVPISVEAGELSGLMRRLVMVAMRPEGFIPCTPARKAQVGGAGWGCRSCAGTGQACDYMGWEAEQGLCTTFLRCSWVFNAWSRCRCHTFDACHD